VIGVGVLVAFLGGIVSFASPCCLPLIPAYLSYMVGTASEGPGSRRTTFAHGLAFVAGFSAVFVGFWASIGAVGYVLADNVNLLRQLGGAILVFLGLQVAGVIDVPALWRDLRPLPAMAGGPAMGGTLGGPAGAGGGLGGFSAVGRPGYRRSLLFGVVFAAGWSPCIGPILGGIIGLASTTASVGQGTVLLAAYAAGLAIPFLAISLGADWVGRRLAVVGRHHRAVSLISGVALIAVGVLMITGTLAQLASLASPFRF
jgi:cytochrome c-type biogenesis protein